MPQPWIVAIDEDQAGRRGGAQVRDAHGECDFLADSDLGMKTGVPLVESYWFESSGGEPLVMCGGPDSTGSATSYELDGVSAEFLGAGRLPACPGTPVDGELSAVLQELKYFGGP